MKQCKHYEISMRRKLDFIVQYKIDLDEELKGSRPSQGMRVDFL